MAMNHLVKFNWTAPEQQTNNKKNPKATHLSPTATKSVQMMRCCPKCHITRMPRDMPAFASTELAQCAVSSCLPRVPGTELGFRGWMRCGCPKGSAEQGQHCSLCIAWAARVHSTAFPQNFFTGGSYHRSF